MSILSTAPAPLRRALPFAALLFLLVAAHGLLETARDGLFLTEQPVSRLPWLYLAVTAGILALTPLQRRLWERRSRLWATDVIAGAVLGGAIGYAVPALHLAFGEEKTAILTPSVSPSYLGLTLAGRF